MTGRGNEPVAKPHLELVGENIRKGNMTLRIQDSDDPIFAPWNLGIQGPLEQVSYLPDIVLGF